MYQHEIAIIAEENSDKFQLMAITNLDQVKTLHLAKGEVVGFLFSSCQVTILITRMTFNSSPSCLMSKESMEITINTSRCYEHAKQWNDTSHISSLK